MLWQSVYTNFRFPLYLSDKEKKPEVKPAVSMMFTHFLVG
jgi:hypothetical protein